MYTIGGSSFLKKGGLDPEFGNGGGGGKIYSEASYERSELRVKRVTSEASYERSEYKPAEFRTPESESERNLTNYFIIFLLLFY